MQTSVSTSSSATPVPFGPLGDALVAAGVHAPQAVAAVLLYRLISFWLVDALGWVLYLTTRKRERPLPPASDVSVDLSR